MPVWSQPRLGYFRQGCAPKVRACLHTHQQQPLSASRRFRFYFSGQPKQYFPGSAKKKTPDNVLLKNHDLAAGANRFKTTFRFLSITCCCF